MQVGTVGCEVSKGCGGGIGMGVGTVGCEVSKGCGGGPGIH